MTKRQFIMPKKCLWCEKVIEVGQRSPAQYNKISTHKGCITSWVRHRMPERLVEEIQDRGIVHCEACNNRLVRRENEHTQAWLKRRFCGKSCAATKSGGGRAIYDSPKPTDEERLHLKRYVPGSPEFNQLAQHYLERGF